MCSKKCNVIALAIMGGIFVVALIPYIVVLNTYSVYYGSTCSSIYEVNAGEQPICRPYEWREAYFSSHGRNIKAYQLRADELGNLTKSNKNVTFEEKSSIKGHDYTYAIMTKSGSYQCELSAAADFYLMNKEEFINFSSYEHQKPARGPTVSNSKTASFTFSESKDEAVYVVISNEKNDEIDASESGWFMKDTYDLEKSNFIKACSRCYFDIIRDPDSTYQVLRTVIIPDYNGPKKVLPVTLLNDLEVDGTVIALFVVLSIAMFALLVPVVVLGICAACRASKSDYSTMA